MLTLATHALRPTAVTTCSSSSVKSRKRSLRWLNLELCPQASHPSNFCNNCCKCSQVKKVNRPYLPQDSHRRIVNLNKASSSEWDATLPASLTTTANHRSSLLGRQTRSEQPKSTKWTTLHHNIARWDPTSIILRVVAARTSSGYRTTSRDSMWSTRPTKLCRSSSRVPTSTTGVVDHKSSIEI